MNIFEIAQKLDKEYPHSTDLIHFFVGFFSAFNETILAIVTVIFIAYQVIEYFYVKDNVILDILEYFIGVVVGVIIW